MEKHPYMSGGGTLVSAVTQFRKALPPVVNADTFRKLGIGAKNESFLINIFRFLQVIDAEGKPTVEGRAVFNRHEDEEFQPAFGKLVEAAYQGLFNLYGDSAWKQPTSKLISFFRGSDSTSELVGRRQAVTFETLAALCGHSTPPTPKAAPAKVEGKRPAAPKVRTPAAPKDDPVHTPPPPPPPTPKGESPVGLTVRIEVNLPAGGDKDTYDAIFKSIKENLLGGR